jgi:hypothetical protein
MGTLTCSLLSSIGMIVGSQRNVSCQFRGAPGEPDEPYAGTMTMVGLDVGLTTGSVIICTVFADTSRHKGMLTPRQRPRRRIAPELGAAATVRPVGSLEFKINKAPSNAALRAVPREVIYGTEPRKNSGFLCQNATWRWSRRPR